MASCCSEKCQASKYAPQGKITHQGSRALNQISKNHSEYSTAATIHVGPSIARNFVAMECTKVLLTTAGQTSSDKGAAGPEGGMDAFGETVLAPIGGRGPVSLI